jgi:hypothetical protein
MLSQRTQRTFEALPRRSVAQSDRGIIGAQAAVTQDFLNSARKR